MKEGTNKKRGKQGDKIVFTDLKDLSKRIEEAKARLSSGQKEVF